MVDVLLSDASRRVASVRAAGAGRGRAVLVLVREAEILEHLHILLDGRAGGREHVARDGGRGACLERRRAASRQELAPRREADVRRRVDVAEEGDRAQDVLRGQLGPPLHARARNRHERVDGDGLDAELLQGIAPPEPSFRYRGQREGRNILAGRRLRREDVFGL